MFDIIKPMIDVATSDATTQVLFLLFFGVLFLATQVYLRAEAITEKEAERKALAGRELYSPASDILRGFLSSQVSEEEFQREFRKVLIEKGYYLHIDPAANSQLRLQVDAWLEGYRTADYEAQLRELFWGFEDEVLRTGAEVLVAQTPTAQFVTAMRWLSRGVATVVLISAVFLVLLAIASDALLKQTTGLQAVAGLAGLLLLAGVLYLGFGYVAGQIRKRAVMKGGRPRSPFSQGTSPKEMSTLTNTTKQGKIGARSTKRKP